MRIQIIALAIITTIAVLGCKSKLDKEADVLYDQVMEIHDEVMPKMKDIHKAKKGLKKLRTDNNATIVDAMIQRLDNADEAMMSWMHDFNRPDGTDKEQTMSYLNAEMVKVKEVKRKMLTSIEDATVLIENMTSINE